MYDTDNICWHDSNRERCSVEHHNDLKFAYGRCRSGKCWFWMAQSCFDDQAHKRHGWEDSEDQAVAAARAAIKQMADGRPAAVYAPAAGWASLELKALNKTKRDARLAAHPSAATGSRPVEYLYAHQSCNGEMSEYCDCHQMDDADAWNYHMIKFTIVKKTEQRIYYNRCPIDVVEHDYGVVRDLTEYGTRFVDRRILERDGEIWSHKGGGWWEADCRLYLAPPLMPDWRRSPEAPNLQQLKAEMAAAHPDHGGSEEAFIAARKRYVQARDLAM